MTIAGGQSLNGRAPIAVEHHTADATLTAAECGTLHTNKGAGGAISLTLPAASAANLGLRFRFVVLAAQQLKVEPNGTDQISLPTSGVPETAGDYVVADAIAEALELVCVDAGLWAAFGTVGTWTGQ